MAERNMREELGFADEPDDDGFWGGGEFCDGEELYDDEEDLGADDCGADLRPEWLHPDCRDVCSALERGTCCKYPAGPVVRIAVALVDAVARAESRLGGMDCQQAGAELGRCFRELLGLLAQIHATVAQLNQKALAQLLCPVGTLAGALDRACGDGCPWGCEHPAVPDRRVEFSPLGELVAECAATVQATLSWILGQRPGNPGASGFPGLSGTVVVPPRRVPSTGE